VRALGAESEALAPHSAIKVEMVGAAGGRRILFFFSIPLLGADSCYFSRDIINAIGGSPHSDAPLNLFTRSGTVLTVFAFTRPLGLC
jgi:hypothetical protein